MKDEDRARALKLVGTNLPDLVRALTPERIFYDRSRQGRRMREIPARWARPPQGFPPAHRHQHFELCFALQGSCPFLLGDEHRTVRAGELIVLSPQVCHRELAGERSDPYQLLWVNCGKPNIFVHMQVYLGGKRFEHERFSFGASVPEALQICGQIDLELWEQRPGAVNCVQGKLLELCGLIERAVAEKTDSPKMDDAMQRWRTSRAINYVKDHFAQPLDLSEVALHAGVSPAYLSALFSRELGQSFTDFLAACRINEAQRLIKDSELSIKEIAVQVGVQNPFYFSRMFRKHTGISPRQYRQRLVR